MKSNVAETIYANLKDKGFTLTGWSRARGFKPRTVRAVLYENMGTCYGRKSSAIVEALIEDGFYPDDEVTEAA